MLTNVVRGVQRRDTTSTKTDPSISHQRQETGSVGYHGAREAYWFGQMHSYGGLRRDQAVYEISPPRKGVEDKNSLVFQDLCMLCLDSICHAISLNLQYLFCLLVTAYSLCN